MNEKSIESLLEPVPTRRASEGATLPEPWPESASSVALAPGGSSASCIGWLAGAERVVSTSAFAASAPTLVSV